jgi:hypothetical protein
LVEESKLGFARTAAGICELIWQNNAGFVSAIGMIQNTRPFLQEKVDV